MKAPSLQKLFLAFLKLGAISFGGPAMVAYIRRLAVEENAWLDESSFRDGVALCQAIPGATAMQTAAYVGLKVRGVLGAAASFVGFGLPAFAVMMVFSSLYVRSHSLPVVAAIFAGLGAIVVAIAANATLSFGRDILISWRRLVIVLAAAVLLGLRMSPLAVIMLSSLMGYMILKAPPSSPALQSAAPPLRTAGSFIKIILTAAAALGLLFLISPRLFALSALMLKIDVLAFGGGFASVPLMYHEVVDVRAWLAGPTLLDGIALGQITPGPIVITATFIGYLVSGPLGGVVATVSVFLPSYSLVIAVAPYYEKLRSSPRFHKVIGGIFCAFVGLLLSVTVRFAANVSWNLPRLLLAFGALLALRLRVNILWVVLAGTALSLVFP